MNSKEAEEHREATKELLIKYWSLLNTGLGWMGDEEEKLKEYSKEIHERIRSDQDLYPDTRTELDEHGGLTIHFRFFHRP
jgi:hypothetical protein